MHVFIKQNRHGKRMKTNERASEIKSNKSKRTKTNEFEQKRKQNAKRRYMRQS